MPACSFSYDTQKRKSGATTNWGYTCRRKAVFDLLVLDNISYFVQTKGTKN